MRVLETLLGDRSPGESVSVLFPLGYSERLGRHLPPPLRLGQELWVVGEQHFCPGFVENTMGLERSAPTRENREWLEDALAARRARMRVLGTEVAPCADPLMFRSDAAEAPDPDSDAVPDETERRLGMDPLDPTDALGDWDRDGLSNRDEILDHHASPTRLDSDGDGAPDGDEIAAGTNPHAPPIPRPGLGCRVHALGRVAKVNNTGWYGFPDWAAPLGAYRTRMRCRVEGQDYCAVSPFADPSVRPGGRPRGLEFARESRGPSCALARDADGDGLSDAVEVELGTDPERADSDADGVPDGGEDADGDGLADAEELRVGADPRSADSDCDGIPDGEEVLPGRDGVVTDLLEWDSDGDGLADGFEVGRALDPLDPADGDGESGEGGCGVGLGLRPPR